MKRVLLVCHANVSRSVIAEKVLQRLLAARGLERAVEVRSGGIAPYARDGSLMSLDAHFVLKDAGIDVPRETGATDLKRQRHLVSAADVILVLDEGRHSGGVGEGVVTALVEAGFGHLPLRRVCGADTYTPLAGAAMFGLPSDNAVIGAALELAQEP